MAFCSKCGVQLSEEDRFCPSCGAACQSQKNEQSQPSAPTTGSAVEDTIAGTVQSFSNAPDHTEEYTKEDITENKVLSIFAYLGPLVLIPLLAAPKSKFARFHSNQGLVLFLAEVIWGIVYGVISSILYAIFWIFGMIFSIAGLVSVVFFVFAIIGIVNVVNGKAKELPLIGKIKLLK